MTYPGYPPPAKPPRSGADLAISIAALTLTVLFGAAAAFFGACPPATCSAEGAVTAVLTSRLVAGGIGVVGLVVTIVALVRRRTAWPFGVGTLVLCVLVVFLGGVGYIAAVS